MQTRSNLSWEFTGISELLDQDLIRKKTIEESFPPGLETSLTKCIQFLTEQSGYEFPFTVMVDRDTMYISSPLLEEKPELVAMFNISRTDYD